MHGAVEALAVRVHLWGSWEGVPVHDALSLQRAVEVFAKLLAVIRDRADPLIAPHLHDLVCAYDRAVRESHRWVATRGYPRRRLEAVAPLCQDRSAAARRDR